MRKIITFGKCPACHSQIFFGKKQVLEGEHFAERLCPYCGASLKHSVIKIALSLLCMLIPSVIINYTYPVSLRLLALVISTVLTGLVWFLFGYKLYSKH